MLSHCRNIFLFLHLRVDKNTYGGKFPFLSNVGRRLKSSDTDFSALEGKFNLTYIRITNGEFSVLKRDLKGVCHLLLRTAKPFHACMKFNFPLNPFQFKAFSTKLSFLKTT